MSLMELIESQEYGAIVLPSRTRGIGYLVPFHAVILPSSRPDSFAPWTRYSVGRSISVIVKPRADRGFELVAHVEDGLECPAIALLLLPLREAPRQVARARVPEATWVERACWVDFHPRLEVFLLEFGKPCWSKCGLRVHSHGLVHLDVSRCNPLPSEAA